MWSHIVPAQEPRLIFVEIALLMFVAIFTMALLRVWLAPRTHVETMAHLPLASDEQDRP